MNSHECGTLKFCTICKEHLPLGRFKERKYTTKKGTKSTYRYSKCDTCNTSIVRKKANAKYAEDPEKVLRVSRATYQKNKEFIKIRTNAYYADNRDKYAGYRAKNSADNRERERANARKNRRLNLDKDKARVKKAHEHLKTATPRWANKVEIRQIYKNMTFLNTLGGAKYNVDHIIPLHGVNVSGLHVENNLQIVTAKANMAKANKLSDDIC